MEKKQEMTLTTEAFMTLSQQLSDRDVKYAKLDIKYEQEHETRLKLEADLEAQKSENGRLLAEIERLKAEKDEAEFRATFLRQYIILSAEKIRDFVLHLKNIDRWAFLRSFVMWVIPEEYRNEEMVRIDEVMALPADERQGITMNNPMFQGPMYDVHDNSDVELGRLPGGLQHGE